MILLLELKAQGYSEATLRAMGRKLRGLAKNVNLQDPEAVRTYIADQPWSSGHKGNLVNAYDHYLRAQGLSWEKPVYESVDQIQKIPRLEDINKIISGASPKYACMHENVDDAMEEVRKLSLESYKLKGNPSDDPQKMVSEEQLENYLARGWNVQTVLPSGRIVVKKNG